MCSAKGHVRFAPNSDRESGFPQTVMSALPPKADMCGALAHVCFGPKADILRSGNDVRFLPKSGRLHREPLVAVMSHFHEESSLLCELSHIRKVPHGQYTIPAAKCPIKGSIKCHSNWIPAALSKLSCSAGWRCFSYSRPSYPPEQPRTWWIVILQSRVATEQNFSRNWRESATMGNSATPHHVMLMGAAVILSTIAPLPTFAEFENTDWDVQELFNQ